MKKKESLKKLSLNRQTISNLSKIKGGEAPTQDLKCTALLCPGTGCVCPSGETCGIYCPVVPVDM
jgi:hypothetical protein